MSYLWKFPPLDIYDTDHHRSSVSYTVRRELKHLNETKLHEIGKSTQFHDYTFALKKNRIRNDLSHFWDY